MRQVNYCLELSPIPGGMKLSLHELSTSSHFFCLITSVCTVVLLYRISALLVHCTIVLLVYWDIKVLYMAIVL